MDLISADITSKVKNNPGIFSTILCLAGLSTLKLYMYQSNYRKYTKPFGSSYSVHQAVPNIDKINNKSSRTILITGGCGFLGRNIVSLIFKDGSNVHINIIVLDLIIPTDSLKMPSVTYIQGNLLDKEILTKIFSSFSIDSVLHCAGLIPFLGVPDKAIWEVNVSGTRNILDISQKFGVKNFVYTSSATVVLSKSDRNPHQLTEDVPYPKDNLDTYTQTKKAAELLVIEASKAGKMTCCILRPAAVFGKGDKLVSDNAVRGVDAFIIGHPECRIDWVPVECVAWAHILVEKALQDPSKRSVINGNAYFIGNNEENEYGWFFGFGPATISHWEQPAAQRLPIWLVDILATVNEASYMFTGLPVLAPTLCHSLTDYTRRSYTFSSNKAFQHFGYKPLMSVSTAIRKLVDDYKR